MRDVDVFLCGFGEGGGGGGSEAEVGCYGVVVDEDEILGGGFAHWDALLFGGSFVQGIG